MKKRRFLVAVLVLAMTATASFVATADETELLARIEALEARVAALESALGTESAETAQPSEMDTATGPVVLGIGTWIVGQDIPAGVYDLTSPDGTAYVKIYESYEQKESGGYYREHYDVASQSYLDALLAAAGGENEEIYRSMYSTLASNIRLEDGYCLFIEDASAEFTPAQ